jgi:hypothetical protein
MGLKNVMSKELKHRLHNAMMDFQLLIKVILYIFLKLYNL